jgi:hypothetical protein
MSDTLPDSVQIPAEALGIVISPAPAEGSHASPGGAQPPSAAASADGDAAHTIASRRGHGVVFSGAWEQELIISGAVVFALMQVPGTVDAAFARLQPHLSEGTFMIGVMGFQYVKLILYTLIAAFVIHLSSRAYWVGLIGLHSVFPGGVREDELKQGPITREVNARLTPTLPRAIAVTDDFCSSIFSFSFMMVAGFLMSTLWGVVMAAATWVVSKVLFGGVWQGGVFLGFLLFGFGPAAVMLADRRWGERLRPGSTAHRLMKGALTLYHRALVLQVWAPISRVLFSNLPRRKAYTGFYLLVVGLIGFFLVTDILSRMGLSAVDGARFLPAEDDARTVNGILYEDQRPDGEIYALTPSIPSDVVQGPYVRLFIPYSPRRQDAAVADRCAGVRPLSELRDAADGDLAAVLACLARLQPVSVNGRALNVPFRFRTDPRSGMRGIVAYVPTGSLPRGENVITVARAPRSRSDESLVKRAPQPPYVIRFWL